MASSSYDHHHHHCRSLLRLAINVIIAGACPGCWSVLFQLSLLELAPAHLIGFVHGSRLATMPIKLANKALAPSVCVYCEQRQRVRACVLCSEWRVRVCCGGALLDELPLCGVCWAHLDTAPNRAVHVHGPRGRASWKRRVREWEEWLASTLEAVEVASQTLPGA